MFKVFSINSVQHTYLGIFMPGAGESESPSGKGATAYRRTRFRRRLEISAPRHGHTTQSLIRHPSLAEPTHAAFVIDEIRRAVVYAQGHQLMPFYLHHGAQTHVLSRIMSRYMFRVDMTAHNAHNTKNQLRTQSGVLTPKETINNERTKRRTRRKRRRSRNFILRKDHSRQAMLRPRPLSTD
ncbi:hypothetical protein V8C44DRAFT_343316 [Trichoderma aethiopicum]